MDKRVESYGKGPVNMNGFTIMEMLIVFCIISILGMISMPLYQNHTVRTKVSGDFTLMRPLLVSLQERYSRFEVWPTTNAEAGARAPEYYRGQYLQSAHISDQPQPGSITLTYNTDALPVLRGANTIVFYPEINSGSTNWHCDQGTMPGKYRPDRCHR